MGDLRRIAVSCIRGRNHTRLRMAASGVAIGDILLICVAIFGALGGGTAWASAADVRDHYNIAGGPADKSLVEFARQSKEAHPSLLIPTDSLSQFTTNSLH